VAERCLKEEVEAKMGRIGWQERIVVDAKIHHGDACVKGTRIPVSVLLGSLADGMTAGQAMEAYPQLVAEDIAAVLAYAAEILHQETVVPLTS